MYFAKALHYEGISLEEDFPFGIVGAGLMILVRVFVARLRNFTKILVNKALIIVAIALESNNAPTLGTLRRIAARLT